MSKKYAVLVGINIYECGSNLRGCVNDVENMYNLLTSTYGFQPDRIRVLTDQRATKRAILGHVNWLVKQGVAGDQLVLHYSGHGSQVRDRDGDELKDHEDEILCSTDLDWDDPLTDDMLAAQFRNIRQGVNFTFIADCCHSGSMNKGIARGVMPRYLDPPFDIRTRSYGRKLKKRRMGVKGILDWVLETLDGDDSGEGVSMNVHYNEKQNHILLSGCRDDQTSADAWIDTKHQGALTTNLVRAIGANPAQNALEVHNTVLKALKATGYTQVPQLTGSKEILATPLFGAPA